MTTTTKTYIGDGVYIDVDENFYGAYILTAENGYAATDTIYLEPDVVDKLISFVETNRS